MSLGLTLSILTMVKNGKDYSHILKLLPEKKRLIVEKDIRKLKDRMKEGKAKEEKDVK